MSGVVATVSRVTCIAHRGHSAAPKWRSLVPLFALYQLVGCSVPFDPAATFYIVMEEDQQEMFLSDLDALSRAHGLTAVIGRAKPDHGPTMHVLEARGHFLRLWSQNGILSAGECGVGSVDGSADQNKFVLTVIPRFALPVRGKAKVLSTEIASELEAKGYRVLSKEPECARIELARGNAK